MAKIAVIPGDGVGNEVIPQAVRVLQVVSELSHLNFSFEFFDYGATMHLRTGRALPAPRYRGRSKARGEVDRAAGRDEPGPSAPRPGTTR